MGCGWLAGPLFSGNGLLPDGKKAYFIIERIGK